MLQTFLGQPLVFLLNALGYTVLSNGSLIYFQDLTSNTFTSVHIAESCSGLTSIQIFISALISYLLIERKRLDLFFINVLLVGLFVSYLANIFRMAIIILSGHYYGMEILQIVHETAGWFIFTFWIFFFWVAINKFINTNNLGADIK